MTKTNEVIDNHLFITNNMMKLFVRFYTFIFKFWRSDFSEWTQFLIIN